jgi:hypothetical protein
VLQMFDMNGVLTFNPFLYFSPFFSF